jgi:Transposase DDE domain
MTAQKYAEYLIATPQNYTCTNFADHLQGEQYISHDAISDYLKTENLTPIGLWKTVQGLINDDGKSFLILDDSVQSKKYSYKIEMVKVQYSGAEGGVVKGIGIVNLLHSNGEKSDYYPIDYRVYSPEEDGKTKHKHFQEMLLHAKEEKEIQAQTILFDTWYASTENLKFIIRLGMYFVTTIASNRVVSLSKEDGYVHLEDIEWSEERLLSGVLVKLKKLPFLVRLFKIVATNGDIEWVITNKATTPEDQGITSEDVDKENAVRWQIEQLHREVKQLVGTAKCQCRSSRSQRNHLHCCYLAWVALKVYAKKMGMTLYAAKASLWRDYLVAELKNPRIRAYQIA